MICDYCENEMNDEEGTFCKEGLDEAVIKGTCICGDCNAAPGSCHHPGCDVERCGECGDQAISCECDDKAFWEARPDNRWTGAWPGHAECIHHGLFCHDLIDGKVVTELHEVIRRQNHGERVQWHVPCDADAEGAHPDLNRWHDQGCPPIPLLN